ncbi:hypothetical protein HKD37_04G010764 [Glycine soja]
MRLKIHHGGMFIYKPSTVYVNGEIVEEEWGWDVDTMSDPRKALCRGLKPLNCDSNILQLAEDVSSFDVVEVYVEEGVFDKSEKKLNDFKGDEVVVIDGVEAEPVVEGEDKAQVQLDEEGLVEVEVQDEDEAGVVGEMEVVVEGVDNDDVGVEEDDDVGVEEDDDDSSDCSEVSDIVAFGRKSTVLTTYSFIVYPCNGLNLRELTRG